MSFKLVLVVFAFAVLLSKSSAVILDCNYANFNVWRINGLYTCRARVLSIGNVEIISQVSQNHLLGRDNSDVRGISIRDPLVRVMPRNFAEFFPNLESIDMHQSQIEVITKEHFKGLLQLRQLHFSNNRVQTIDSNLFVYNPVMFAAMFNNNPVRNIGYDVFDTLPQLIDLQFRSTTCISQQAQNARNIDEMIFQLTVSCPPTIAMIEEKISNSFGFQRNIDKQISDRVNPVSSTVFNLTQEVRVLQQQVSELRNNCGC